jgi:hypothetical protein
VQFEAEGIPQRLKPNLLQGIYVRPEGRTLQENEFFRSLPGTLLLASSSKFLNLTEIL